MPDKTTEEKPSEAKPIRKGGKWFRRIPKEILLSPGGIILLFFAGFFEILDIILPASLVDSLIVELILEIPFMIMLWLIAKIPFQSLIIPFIIERIPAISDIVPTWLIRMFL